MRGEALCSTRFVAMKQTDELVRAYLLANHHDTWRRTLTPDMGMHLDGKLAVAFWKRVWSAHVTAARLCACACTLHSDSGHATRAWGSRSVNKGPGEGVAVPRHGRFRQGKTLSSQLGNSRARRATSPLYSTSRWHIRTHLSIK